MSEHRWLPPVPASEPPAPAAEPPHAPLDEPVAELAPDRSTSSKLGRLGAPLAALLALAGKLKVVLLALTKMKFLVSSGSMLVSIVAYASLWGWQFGVGFVLLLLVHEYGHVIQLRREGVRDASAPIFIPFLGALIWAKSLGEDAAAEARTALAGPIVGALGAAVCGGLYLLTGEELFRALAFTGFFLNLFNLLPVGFLDGARAAAAMSPWLWLLGVFGIVLLIFAWPNPIILMIGVLSIWETYRRFRAFRAGGPEVEAYYGIAKRDRVLISVTYLALIVALVVAMDITHLQRTL